MSFESEMQAALIADGEKLRAMTGEDHGPWEPGDYLTYRGDGRWVPCDISADDLAALHRQLATMRAALAKIEKWHGEFPPTGKFWPSGDGAAATNEMSYAVCYGTNGERDFMRSVARAALSS